MVGLDGRVANFDPTNHSNLKLFTGLTVAARIA
jgi:hypothetical protein